MQADSIIEKAKRLGLDTGSGVSEADSLRIIAAQLGVSDLEELNDTLDQMLQSENEDSYNDGIEELYSEDNTPVQESFGKKEYDAARDEKGKYDKNYYDNRGKELDEKVKKAEAEKNNPEKEVMKKNEQGQKTPVQQQKNVFDRAKDNVNLFNAKKDRLMNKWDNTKANAYRAMHPEELLKEKANEIKDAAKDKAKEVAKDTAKKAGKQVGKALASAGKAIGKAALSGIQALISFLVANPIVAIIVVVVILVILILIMLIGTVNENSGVGYFDSNCNYNTTTVNLEICSDNTTEKLSLEDYVLGATYSYTKDGNYSDETIKALMIIIKTNALSLGNYSSSSKEIDIDDCDKEYTLLEDINDSDLDNLQDLYSEIGEELFISTSYTTTISNLSSRNSLELNDSILDEMEDLSRNSNYETILNEIYNNEVEEDTEIEVENNRPTIFVGDSRMNGMKNYGIVTDSNSVYAGAMGYYWFVGTSSSTFNSSTYNCNSNAIECINNKLGSDSANIVIWLGVNDPNNYENYYNKYYELATGEWKHHYIYIVEVGYVDDDRSPYVKNSAVENFNDYMKRSINGSGLSNLIYVELGYESETMAEGTIDGVHYSSNFSSDIYNKMQEQIGSSISISEKKAIYKLSNYCTYYNITQNDAYWWPIGSSNSTTGNIYGGEPTTTTVVSPFGPRVVEGKSSNHKGIDIAGNGCESNVIIATKGGTITTASDTCDNNGEYENKCGGGYGNYIMIDHGDGTSSVYAHLYPDSIQVSVGDTVEQGEKLALMGNSGSSTGCHLHFEIRINGVHVNPLEYVSAKNPRPVSTYTLGDVDDSATSAEENKVAICKSLLNSGFSENAVAGMLVNIQAEGAFRTTNLENCYEENQCCTVNGKDYGFCVHTEIRGFGSDALYTAGVDSGAYPREKFVNDRAGYGLIQWTSSGRKAGLYDYAKAENKSIGALSVQLGWLLEELKGYPITYKYLTGNYNAEEIAKHFCLDFESPSNENVTCPTRARTYTNSMLTFVENGCS